MKTKTTISDINHNDLVNLLSTALYGSSWLGITYNKTEYPNSEPSEDDCIEDKAAKILLHGYSITLYDMYAEDEEDHYGTLPYSWDERGETMDYTVTLADIKRGLEKAMNYGGWPAKYVYNLMNEDSDFDQPQAESLVQWILFGEEIYG